MHGTKGCYDPHGSSPDLMPSIMGAFDAYLVQKKRDQNTEEDPFKTSTPKRSHQLNNFAHLSPCVQKILSHVPEQEISKKFSSEETLVSKRNRMGYRSLRGPEKINSLNKSNESLDLSPGVHKLLSNLQDSELVISTSNLHVRTLTSNDSYLHSLENRPKFSIFDRQPSSVSVETSTVDESDAKIGEDEVKTADQCGNYVPLGSYLHSGKGIASRTPVGRKLLGKYLQVPSESSGVSASTNSPTSSSEDSRPVSMTSLASSSSESSGGHPQPCSAYLASVESLDSDPEPGGSQGSADSGIAEQEKIPIKPEQRVLQEVLDTETVYVADLNEVITGYLIPWRNDPSCPLAHCLTDLFSNIEEICKFNREILEDIRRANLDPSKTANVFLQHDAGFRVYNEYCANYPRTMEVLSELQKDEQMAPLFREKQQHLRHALPLGSYLLKPVQRILKYHLLLQRLSKQCEGNHKSTVDLALATMTAVASEINNMKKKHEYAVRVQEIQSQLYGWTGPDLTTLGELIAEGSFRVQGARGRRHVFLFEKVLLLAKTKTGSTLAYKTHIECSNLMLVEQVRSDPLAFQVLPFDNPRQQCTLRARSPHHKREWTLQIKRVMLENYSAVIPNHARQLVMQLGQDVTETEDASEKWSPLKHNSPTPHYLERRSRRKTQELMKDHRSASQDRMFPALGSWRRKSEPSMIPQVFDSKTVPKKITKLKKTKETGSSTFYTDISDADDAAPRTAQDHPRSTPRDVAAAAADRPSHAYGHDIKQIVSDLLMQNEDFKKVLNREHTRHPRRNVNSEPGPMWYCEERLELPSKADSLPRSFQLNEPTEEGVERAGQEVGEGNKLNGCRTEGELSSQMTEPSDYPEHKIYRKSAIRTSLLQRIRTLISEDQKRPARHVSPHHHHHHDTNKATGEKLAHPDYVDPQKLFIGSRTTSELNISSESSQNSIEKSRLYRTSPSDGYYESILDDSLTEEYVRDKSTGKLVAKSDSFSSTERAASFTRAERPVPPPIPAKPLRLTVTKPRTANNNQHTPQSSCLNVNGREKSLNVPQKTANGSGSTGWVKTMVDRFE